MHVAPERYTGSQCDGYSSSTFPISKVQVRAMSSANWDEVPGIKGLASVVSKLETSANLAVLFPSKAKLLPSVYQISSGLVRGSSDNSSWGFVPCVPRFLGKSEWGESPCGQAGGWLG